MNSIQNRKWFGVLFFLLAMAVALQCQQMVIVDHTCTDISRIPSGWIAQAKSALRVTYGHTSHGSQLVTGILAFRGSPGSITARPLPSWSFRRGVASRSRLGAAMAHGPTRHRLGPTSE